MNRVLALMERWFNSPNELGNGFAIIGIIAIGIGNFLNFQIATNLGLACFGAGIVAWGVNAVQRGEIAPLRRGRRLMPRVEGFLARAWGVLMILGGLGLLGFGILSLLNPRSPVPASVRRYFDTPQGLAFLLLLGSAIGVLYALTMIFVSNAQADNRYVRFLKGIPGRLVGVLLFFLFGTLATASLIQIFAPDTWQSILQSILQALGIL